MFKLLSILALVVGISAKPTSDISSPSIVSYGGPLLKTAFIAEPTHVAIAEPTYAKVGEYVERVPTAVSHQSSTIVHNRANVVRSIVAPAVRTHLTPVVRSYSANTPLITYRSGYPFATYYGAPYYLDGYAHNQLYKSYA